MADDSYNPKPPEAPGQGMRLEATSKVIAVLQGLAASVPQDAVALLAGTATASTLRVESCSLVGESWSACGYTGEVTDEFRELAERQTKAGRHILGWCALRRSFGDRPLKARGPAATLERGLSNHEQFLHEALCNFMLSQPKSLSRTLGCTLFVNADSEEPVTSESLALWFHGSSGEPTSRQNIAPTIISVGATNAAPANSPDAASTLSSAVLESCKAVGALEKIVAVSAADEAAKAMLGELQEGPPAAKRAKTEELAGLQHTRQFLASCSSAWTLVHAEDEQKAGLSTPALTPEKAESLAPTELSTQPAGEDEYV
eukprot:TRINITY_DN33467_c0_g1_i1.p2 TRINITY_DN33467_c0_g1~~TRINITY_DN33467_c0_g1_i1.p2  ORF type:complete len:316 (+),score=67.79 TRINITY_DN33467_c0_g1_i1:184-1131(+)